MQGRLLAAGILSSALLAALPILCGCGSIGDVLYDFDGDGSLDEDDCAPEDPAIFPDAPTDIYGDGVDGNCDGNDGIDNDRDGYPAPGEGVPAEIEDCNDSNADINPDTEELPVDNIDQNCDGFDATTVVGAPGVTISPPEPRTDDDLVASVTWVAGATSLSWFVDGIEDPKLKSMGTVPSSATVKGQVWRAVATAEIGGETREGEASVTISNSPPNTESVQVWPNVGTVLDSFECVATSSDADGDPLSLSYRWFVDDQSITATTAQITAADGFQKGDWLDCEITVSDLSEVAASVASSQSATVLNSPPSDPGPPTPAQDSDAFTDENLLCEAGTASSDPDGDPLTYTLEWIENSAVLPSLTAQFAEQASLALQLDAAMTQRDEQWSCRIRASDGSQVSDSAASATITIINSPPTAPFVETDTAATSGIVTPTQEIRCYVDGSSTDADLDTISYHMAWLQNGNLSPYEITSATSNPDLVLPASYTNDGDLFTCVVTPSDDLEDGEPAEACVGVCGDTRLTFQNDTDYVSIPRAGIPNYGPAGTIEAWIYLETLSYSQIFGHWQDSAGDVQIKMSADGTLRSYLWSSAAAVSLDSPQGVLIEDQWQHVALQWDSTGVSLWLDGSQVDSSTTSVTPATSALSLYLGKNVPRAVSWDSAFRGSIQNLRISNVARYSIGGPGPQTFFPIDNDTVVLYRLDDGNSTLDTTSTGGAAVPSSSNLWTDNVVCLAPPNVVCPTP